ALSNGAERMNARPRCQWLFRLGFGKRDIGGKLREPTAERRLLLGCGFIPGYQISIPTKADRLPFSTGSRELGAELFVLLGQSLAVSLDLLVEQNLAFCELLTLGEPDTTLI